MGKILYQRRITSNNNKYQTEESIKELISERMPDATEITVQLVPCFDIDNVEYNEDGHMDMSFEVDEEGASINGIYNEFDEILECNFIYYENN